MLFGWIPKGDVITWAVGVFLCLLALVGVLVTPQELPVVAIIILSAITISATVIPPLLVFSKRPVYVTEYGVIVYSKIKDKESLPSPKNIDAQVVRVSCAVSDHHVVCLEDVLSCFRESVMILQDTPVKLQVFRNGNGEMTTMDKAGVQRGKRIEVHWKGCPAIIRHEWLHMLREIYKGDNDPPHLDKEWWNLEKEI